MEEANQAVRKFMFPVSLKKGMEFKCKSKLLDYLLQEAKVSPQKFVMKQLDEGAHRRLHLTCKVCNCNSFSLLIDRKSLIVEGCSRRQHIHHIKAPPVAEGIRSILRPRKTSQHSDLTYQRNQPNERGVIRRPVAQSNLPQEVDLKIQESSIQEQEQQPNSDSSEQLETWLGAHNYTSREVKTDKMKSLIMVSPAMLKNYYCYRDALYFDVVYDLLRPTDYGHILGVMSVCDCSNRLQLAGVVFLGIETADHLEDVLQSFFQIHRYRYPSSIFTDENHEISRAVSSFQEKAKIGHLVNPWYAVQKLRNELKGDSVQISGLIATLMQAMQTRHLSEFNTLAEGPLANRVLNFSFKEFLKKYPTLFYCMNGQYVGLSRTNTQQLFNEIKVGQREKILKVICNLHELDQKLNKRPRERFNYEFDLSLINQELLSIQGNCNKEVVGRFVENFIIALRECQAEEVKRETYAVRKGNSNFVVSTDKRWDCSCKELQRTGVACSHLIKVALIKGEKSYLKLLLPRWIHNEQV